MPTKKQTEVIRKLREKASVLKNVNEVQHHLNSLSEEMAKIYFETQKQISDYQLDDEDITEPLIDFKKSFKLNEVIDYFKKRMISLVNDKSTIYLCPYDPVINIEGRANEYIPHDGDIAYRIYFAQTQSVPFKYNKNTDNIQQDEERIQFSHFDDENTSTLNVQNIYIYHEKTLIIQPSGEAKIYSNSSIRTIFEEGFEPQNEKANKKNTLSQLTIEQEFPILKTLGLVDDTLQERMIRTLIIKTRHSENYNKLQEQLKSDKQNDTVKDNIYICNYIKDQPKDFVFHETDNLAKVFNLVIDGKSNDDQGNDEQPSNELLLSIDFKGKPRIYRRECDVLRKDDGEILIKRFFMKRLPEKEETALLSRLGLKKVESLYTLSLFTVKDSLNLADVPEEVIDILKNENIPLEDADKNSDDSVDKNKP